MIFNQNRNQSSDYLSWANINPNPAFIVSRQGYPHLLRLPRIPDKFGP